MNINDVITDGTAKFVVRSKKILDMLNLIFPVGCLHLTVAEGTPFAKFGFGQWKLVGQNKCLWGGGTDNVAGTEIEAGLPNITGVTSNEYWVGANAQNGSALYCPGYTESATMITTGSHGSYGGLAFDASRSNPIYGKSTTVQPPAYVVYMWQRIA